MVRGITIRLWVTLKEFNMKEKLKELLSIPTKTWEEERLINYLTSHFEKMGYDYEKDDFTRVRSEPETKQNSKNRVFGRFSAEVFF